MTQRLRGLRIAVTAFVALIVVLYLGFVGLMMVTESRSLGSPPFHAATDVMSRAPHE